MAAPIFVSSGAADRVLILRPALPTGMPKFLRGLLGALRAWWQHLRGRHYDWAILPRWDADIYHGTLLCVLSGAAASVGYADDTAPDKLAFCRGFQRAWTHCLPAGPPRHEAFRALDAAQPLRCAESDPVPHLPVSAADSAGAQAWLGSTGGRTIVGLGLSSAETKKRWTAGLFRLTIEAIERETALLPLIFADAATARMAHELHAALPGSRLAEQLPLPQVAALLQQCDVFVGTDSGLGHMAAAVGCPTVTLFAQAADCRIQNGRHTNSPERFRPFGSHTRLCSRSTHGPDARRGVRAQNHTASWTFRPSARLQRRSVFYGKGRQTRSAHDLCCT